MTRPVSNGLAMLLIGCLTPGPAAAHLRLPIFDAAAPTPRLATIFCSQAFSPRLSGEPFHPTALEPHPLFGILRSLNAWVRPPEYGLTELGFMPIWMEDEEPRDTGAGREPHETRGMESGTENSAAGTSRNGQTRKKIARRALLAMAGAGTLGMAVSAHRWAPLLMDDYEEIQAGHADPAAIRRRLIVALSQLPYAGMEIPPELRLNDATVREGLRNLAELFENGEIILRYRRSNARGFEVDVRKRKFYVHILWLDALVSLFRDVLLHEALHMTARQFEMAIRSVNISLQMVPLLRAIPVTPSVQEERDQWELRTGTILLENDTYAEGLWDRSALLTNKPLRDLDLEFWSYKFKGELEAYGAEMSLLCEEARRDPGHPSLQEYLRRKEDQLRKIYRWSPMYHLRKWWTGGRPYEFQTLDILKTLAPHFRTNTLTIPFLNALIRHVFGSLTPYKAEQIVMIYRAEVNPAFGGIKDDQDPATQQFFDWARPALLGLNGTPLAFKDPGRPSRSLLAAG